jgi:hypothetical protein
MHPLLVETGTKTKIINNFSFHKSSYISNEVNAIHAKLPAPPFPTLSDSWPDSLVSMAIPQRLPI